jgi:hypothetical protein
MATIVVIDDERTFDAGVDHYARTSDEGLVLIAKLYTEWCKAYGDCIELWLDHDLGGDDTIMPIVEFISMMAVATEHSPSVKFTDFVQSINVHSQNPPASEAIVRVLRMNFRPVHRTALPELR